MGSPRRIRVRSGDAARLRAFERRDRQSPGRAYHRACRCRLSSPVSRLSPAGPAGGAALASAAAADGRPATSRGASGVVQRQRNAALGRVSLAYDGSGSPIVPRGSAERAIRYLGPEPQRDPAAATLRLEGGSAPIRTQPWRSSPARTVLERYIGPA